MLVCVTFKVRPGRYDGFWKKNSCIYLVFRYILIHFDIWSKTLPFLLNAHASISKVCLTDKTVDKDTITFWIFFSGFLKYLKSKEIISAIIFSTSSNRKKN